MRRSLATLVLLVLFWGFLAPAVLQASETDLPACCRGNGMHHCSMPGMSHGDPGTPGFRANAPQCPYRLLGRVLSAAGVAVANRTFALEPPSADPFPHATLALRLSAATHRPSGRSPPLLAL